MSDPAPLPATAAPKVKFAYRPWVQRTVSGSARAAAGLLRMLGPARGGSVASFVARRAAPLIGESELALDSLRHAFPDKSEAERRQILRGAWDNLARTTAELPGLTKLVWRDPARPEAGLTDRIELVGGEHLASFRAAPTGIAFLAHFGNWEIMPLVALSHGIRAVTLYRALKNPRLDAQLRRWRGDACDLILSEPKAALRLAQAMKAGTPLAALADQRMPGGPMVPFLGRPAPTNPLFGRLARQFDCPVHGARAIRLPGARFRVEITPPLVLPRDAAGRVDADGATAAITAVIEGWVREYPEQWLWLHNRWGRPKDAAAAG